MDREPQIGSRFPIPDAHFAVEASDLFQTLFEACPFGIAIGGSDLRLKSVNPAFCELLGYTKDELVGKTFYDFTFPDDIGRTELVKINVWKGRFPVQYVKRLMRKDKTVLLAKITNSAIFDATGALQYSFGIVEDISRQSKLEHFRSQLAAIVESSADAIFSLSLIGNIETWNEGAEKMYGYSSTEALSQSAFTLLSPTSFIAKPCVEAIAAVKEGRSADTFEVFHQTKDGRLIPVSLTLSPIKNLYGQIEGMSAIARDMTTQKRTLLSLRQSEQKMKRALRHLSHTNKELEQFAFVASHDLQEPLRTISCFLQLLQQRHAGKLDGEANEFIQFAVSGAKRLQMLIIDLLHFSRSTREQDEAKPMRLSEILDSALSNLTTLVQTNNAKIQIGTVPDNLYLDHQLILVFQNLLSNAIKFRGSPDPQIQISISKSETEWLFQVKDNGIGFEMAHAERVFRIFQRLDVRNKYPGTGVGLAICKKIVEAHGGRIWAESQVGKGSSFHFALPLVCRELTSSLDAGFDSEFLWR